MLNESHLEKCKLNKHLTIWNFILPSSVKHAMHFSKSTSQPILYPLYNSSGEASVALTKEKKYDCKESSQRWKLTIFDSYISGHIQTAQHDLLAAVVLSTVFTVTFCSFLDLTCIVFQQCLLLTLSTKGLAPLKANSQQYWYLRLQAAQLWRKLFTWKT